METLRPLALIIGRIGAQNSIPSWGGEQGEKEGRMLLYHAVKQSKRTRLCQDTRKHTT